LRKVGGSLTFAAVEPMPPRIVTALLSAAALGLLLPTPVAATTTPQAASFSGGVVLDGFGGLHPFGGASLDTSGMPYWPNWDIARSLALLPGGTGGWELDGFGGLHAFGAAGTLGSAPYWPSWDIARALVVNPDGASGYELDGFGGIHPLGGAPPLSGYPYWRGWDIARGLSIHYDAAGTPDGGWVLDGWGGIHNFGAAPALASQHYYSGFDYWQQLHVYGGGTGAYLLGRWNRVDSIGSVGGIGWSSYPNWGGWDIARDMVPVNPLGSWIPQPVDRNAAGALMTRLNNLDRNHHGERSLAGDSLVASIAGAGAGFNLGRCGGSGSIGDRSQDMFQRNYFAHAIPGCSGTNYVWQTYYAQDGVRWSTAGENIAWISLADLPDAAWQINNSWLNSPEHYANITNVHFTSIGCGGFSGSGYQGVSGQVWVWTCDFKG
jgi:cysteine-rich secretory family protein